MSDNYAKSVDEKDWLAGDLWAEINRLRAAVAGPDGFATWQEAATAERVKRVRVEAERDALAAERDALRADAVRVRWALGDGDGKLNTSQLVARAYDLFGKAAKWSEWDEAQGRVDTEMPDGWAFVIQCSPGDWDLYLTNPDGDRVEFDGGCEPLAVQLNEAIDAARGAA